MRRFHQGWHVLAGLTALVALAGAAEAKCTRLAFSVNDYGKDGPAKDAQELLDKHIATWAKERGIAKYTTGKKDVTCELFLDFGLFDEHTCKAEATVCWPEGGPAKPADAKAPGASPASKADKSTPMQKKSAPAKTGAVMKSAAND
ncbi:MAG: hypothetical protein ACM31O_18575 [Bacteroidota bacterium]|jgi:hypothetical protein